MQELGFEMTLVGVVVTYRVPRRWGGGRFVLHMVSVVLARRIERSWLIGFVQDHAFKMYPAGQD